MVDEPVALVAVTAYKALAIIAVGVPVIAQVVELIDKPAGSAGLAVQEVIAPPVLTTLSGVIAVPTVSVALEGT